jgi:hypothetical protein
MAACRRRESPAEEKGMKIIQTRGRPVPPRLDVNKADADGKLRRS